MVERLRCRPILECGLRILELVSLVAHLHISNHRKGSDEHALRNSHGHGSGEDMVLARDARMEGHKSISPGPTSRPNGWLPRTSRKMRAVSSASVGIELMTVGPR